VLGLLRLRLARDQPTISPLQQELALALYDPQRRYRQGEWTFDSTVWSKASYRLARAHGKLRPSPARGRHNMERHFEARLTRAAARLVSLGLAEWRSVRAPDQPARYAQGYKRHRARTRDLLLTEAGLQWVEDRLRKTGLMPVDTESACTDPIAPDGPIADSLAGCDD